MSKGHPENIHSLVPSQRSWVWPLKLTLFNKQPFFFFLHSIIFLSNTAWDISPLTTCSSDFAYVIQSGCTHYLQFHSRRCGHFLLFFANYLKYSYFVFCWGDISVDRNRGWYTTVVDIQWSRNGPLSVYGIKFTGTVLPFFLTFYTIIIV